MTLYSIMIIILSLLLIKAFLIAFTSEFIQKLVYKYQYNWNMEGYLNFTLAQSPMENWGDRNLTMCRYQAFRDDTGKYTMVHWQVLALKLAFVICFEVRTSTWKKISITAYYIRILLWYNKQNIHKYFYNLACGIWYLPWNWPIGTRHSRVPRYKNQKREILSKTSPGWCGTATTAGMIYTRIGKHWVTN